MPIAAASAINPGAAPIARYPAAMRTPRPMPRAQRPLDSDSQLNPAPVDRAEKNICKANDIKVMAARPTIAP